MAEFCYECWNELFGKDYPKERYIISKDLDLCEGCADLKHIVIGEKDLLDRLNPFRFLLIPFWLIRALYRFVRKNKTNMTNEDTKYDDNDYVLNLETLYATREQIIAWDLKLIENELRLPEKNMDINFIIKFVEDLKYYIFCPEDEFNEGNADKKIIELLKSLEPEIRAELFKPVRKCGQEAIMKNKMVQEEKKRDICYLCDGEFDKANGIIFDTRQICKKCIDKTDEEVKRI